MFIDKDGGDKTKVPKIANTHTIEPGTNKATITLEYGSHTALEKGVAFRRHFAQFVYPPLVKSVYCTSKTNLTDCLIES